MISEALTTHWQYIFVARWQKFISTKLYFWGHSRNIDQNIQKHGQDSHENQNILEKFPSITKIVLDLCRGKYQLHTRLLSAAVRHDSAVSNIVSGRVSCDRCLWVLCDSVSVELHIRIEASVVFYTCRSQCRPALVHCARSFLHSRNLRDL